MTKVLSNQRRKRQRGNAFVEFAVTVLPYFALIFATLDFGMAIFIDNMIQGAVREGVRYAATYNTTYPGTTCASQTCAATAAAQAVSMGFLSGTNSSYVHVNYYAPSDLSTPLTTNKNAQGNVVEVRVQNYPWNWMVPLPGYMTGSGLTMSASASDVLGTPPSGPTPTP